MDAGHLVIGDKLKLADGRTGSVVNVTTQAKTQEMFNLTVDTAHTFYVGANGWLAHNAKPCNITQTLWDHIFDGHTTSKTATGGHVQNENVRIEGWEIPPLNDDSFGVARGREIYIRDKVSRRWKVKLTNSTMFPKNWTDDRIKQYIKDMWARARVIKGQKEEYFAEDAKLGIGMKFKIDPSSNTMLESYPIILTK